MVTRIIPNDCWCVFVVIEFHKGSRIISDQSQSSSLILSKQAVWQVIITYHDLSDKYMQNFRSWHFGNWHFGSWHFESWHSGSWHFGSWHFGKNSKVVYCTLWRWLFDAGLVALENISPRKGTYYGTLRCLMLPSRENFPRQWPALCFLQQIFLLPVQCCKFRPTKGRNQDFLLSLWI